MDMDRLPKTEPVSPPGFGSSNHSNLNNMNIRELVSVLRAAFKMEDFDSVEEVLLSRYERLSTDIDLERLARVNAEDELRKRDEELKKREELCERGKIVQESYERLLKDVKVRGFGDRDTTTNTIVALRKKNCELEFEVLELRKLKKKWMDDINANAELRKMNGELESQVCELNKLKEKGIGDNNALAELRSVFRVLEDYKNTLAALEIRNGQLEEEVKKTLTTIDELSNENHKLADEKCKIEKLVESLDESLQGRIVRLENDTKLLMSVDVSGGGNNEGKPPADLEVTTFEDKDEEDVGDYEFGNDTVEPDSLPRNEGTRHSLGVVGTAQPPNKGIKDAQGASDLMATSAFLATMRKKMQAEKNSSLVVGEGSSQSAQSAPVRATSSAASPTPSAGFEAALSQDQVVLTKVQVTKARVVEEVSHGSKRSHIQIQEEPAAKKMKKPPPPPPKTSALTSTIKAGGKPGKGKEVIESPGVLPPVWSRTDMVAADQVSKLVPPSDDTFFNELSEKAKEDKFYETLTFKLRDVVISKWMFEKNKHLEVELSNLRRSKSDFNEKIRSFETKIKSLEELEVDLRAQLESAKVDTLKFKAEVVKLSQQVKSLSSQKDKLVEECKQLSRRIQDLEKSEENMKLEVFEYQRKIEGLNSEVELLTKDSQELPSLSEKVKTLEDENKSMVTMLMKAGDELFANAVAQIRVLNPGLVFNTAGMTPDAVVEGNNIVDGQTKEVLITGPIPSSEVVRSPDFEVPISSSEAVVQSALGVAVPPKP